MTGIFLACCWGSPVCAQRAGAPSLGVDGLVLFREAGSLAVLAVATPYWQPVSTRSEELLGDFRYLPEYASARAQGQVFHLLETDRPEVVAAPDGRFVVVPWGFGPGCAGEAWQAPEWVAAGDTVAFLLHPTRVLNPEPGETPTFDVLGWQQPYPVGDLIPFWRKGRQVNPEWISATEFYELLTVLPSEMAFRQDAEAALGRAWNWVDRKPGRRGAFPVSEILGEWEALRAEVASRQGGRP